MGLFDFFSRKKNRESDKIWLNQSGKMNGLCGDIAACLARRDPVLVAAFHQASLDALAARLTSRGVRQRALPGPSKVRFYGALDDPLLKLCGVDKIASLMKTLGAKEDVPIESSLVTRQIAAAQERIAAGKVTNR
jgi:preprotein translocase subunit SecA